MYAVTLKTLPVKESLCPQVKDFWLRRVPIMNDRPNMSVQALAQSFLFLVAGKPYNINFLCLK